MKSTGINIPSHTGKVSRRQKASGSLSYPELEIQKQFIAAIIDGQERERLRIGKELHDHINQHLSITKLYMEVAGEKAASETKEMITRAFQNLEMIIREIRSLSQSLLPPPLSDLGLIESVEDGCEVIQRTHHIRTRFSYTGFSEERLSADLQLMLFRVFQCLVDNIIHHAAATEIRVRLVMDAEQVILSITDNGAGFNSPGKKYGSGLANVISRTEFFNGKTEIDSSPGRGCVVMITVPLVNG